MNNQVLNLYLLHEIAEFDERYREKVRRKILRDTSDPFSVPEIDFMKYFRLSKDLTRVLIEELRPHINFNIGRSSRVPIELKVLTALNFFGHGSYQKSTGLCMFLSIEQSKVSRIIAEVCNAMVEHVVPRQVKFPTTLHEINTVKRGFMQKFRLPGVIGAIDCTHVAIVAPATEDPVRPALAYYNRKGFYSLNVQTICDSDMTIVNCNARFPGSAHDSGIWALSAIKMELERKHIAGQLGVSFLLGDSGYPLQPWLLTPFLNPAANGPEANFNRRHISARVCVERSFGLLKSRFRCLLQHRTLHYSPEKAAKIVYCCAALHNMAVRRNLPLPDEYLPVVEQQNHIQEEDQAVIHDQQYINHNWLAEGRLIRNNITRHIFN